MTIGTRTRTKTLIAVAALIAARVGAASAAETVEAILARQTQELVDAISAGNASVWEKYLDPECVYVDESGGVLSRKALVGDIRPLPEGVSGTLRVTQFQAAVHGDVAVTTYVNDESESYHGQALHCQYRSTDTWKKTPTGWKLIAGQVLPLRTDPPAVTLPEALLGEYVGVYRLTPSVAFEIRRSGGGLEGQQSDRKAAPLLAEAPDVLFVPGRPRYRYVILRGADGKVTGLAQRREAWDIVWTRGAASKPPKS